MAIILLLICFFASTAGAVVGFGGGIIIKPAVDMLGLLPVPTANFLSGCTVLAMSISALLRSRGSEAKLEVRTSTTLAGGAVCGGAAGKWSFELTHSHFQNATLLGLMQSLCLLIITIFIFVYMCGKQTLPAKQIKSIPATFLIGLLLGLISTFLGVGGGPYNVAVLFYFYSMDAKASAKNSIYIILFSQLSSILLSICSGTVPDFSWSALILMTLGGVIGALAGAALSQKMDENDVVKLLYFMLIIIIGINICNVLKFMILL